MMKRPALLLIFICLLLLVSQGCLSHSDFTIISSKTLNLNNVKIHPKHNKGPTQGQHCQYTVLFFTIGASTDLEKAVDQALLAKRAEVLIDADVSWQFVWIPIIYTQECWKVEGTAYDVS